VTLPTTVTPKSDSPDLEGLSQAQVLVERQKSGYNEVVPPPSHPLRHFLGKFWGLSAWMLELIMLLSALLHNYVDLALMGTLLVFNAVLGEIQDRRSSGAVAALRRQLQINARVYRDQAWKTIPARELVPGDRVRVRDGDIIPADLKLQTGSLTLDQSSLTGESLEAEKAVGETLPSGATVRRGEGDGLVLCTGSKTYFGRTTQLVEQAQPKLHIEAVVAKVVLWLLLIVSLLLSLVTILSLLRGNSFTEILPLMLVLLMSAVPVALPVMFSVTMALGSKELSRSGVLVTRLSASEDAAIMDVLCVDKTGTITQNQLVITEVFALNQASESDVLWAGALASHEGNQDPIDLAFLTAAKERQVFDSSDPVEVLSFQPFTAQNRRTESVVKFQQARLRLVKGALRALSQVCGIDSSTLKDLESRAEISALKGYRTLAVAQGPVEGPIALIGLVSLYDPPRAEASELILALRERGISVKMLTGDALAVATQVGSRVGLPKMRRYADWKQTGQGSDFLNECDGFAEVFPEDKFQIVKHLQESGHVTGMTGDGVNDAPALRQAEVGIAVCSATDIAKSASSVVLTQPGLGNLVTLVDQGRTIYQRILTWIMNKISRTILKAVFVTVAYVATGKFVVSAMAMLLLTSMTDCAKIALATDRVRPSKSPESWKIGRFIGISVVIGLCMAGESLALLGFGWSRYGLAAHEQARYTFSFLTLLYFAAFSILSMRERLGFWRTRPSRTLQAALVVDTLVGTALTRVGLPGLMPLPWLQTLAIFAWAAVSCLIVNDRLKVWLIRQNLPKTGGGSISCEDSA